MCHSRVCPSFCAALCSELHLRMYIHTHKQLACMDVCICVWLRDCIWIYRYTYNICVCVCMCAHPCMLKAMGLDATCPGGSHLSWRFLSLKRRPCSSRMRTHRRGPSPQSYGCVRERCRLADANRHRFPSPRQGLSF